MTRTQDVERLLRSLDAAAQRNDGPDERTGHQDPRAVQDLQRILATDPAPSSRERPVPRPPRRAVRGGALAAALLLAVTSAVLALPPLSGGDQAFASWTPEPGTVPAVERREAAEECRQAQQDGEQQALAEAEAVIAERRGVWTTVVLAGPNGSSALCVTDESRPFYDRGMIGYSGPATAGRSSPAPRELVALALGDGTVDSRPLSMAAGTAGEDVVGITYSSPTYGEVTASVAGGHFALWLPGDELRGASSAGVDLTVSYRDGSTGTSRLFL